MEEFNFNYGPQLMIQKIRQSNSENICSNIESATKSNDFTTSSTTSISSNLKPENASNSAFESTGSFKTASSHSLGSHWKKVATIDETSDATTTPLSPKSVSSSSSMATVTLQGTERVNQEIEKIELENSIAIQNSNLNCIYSILKNDLQKFKWTTKMADESFEEILGEFLTFGEKCSEAMDVIDNEQDLFESDANLDIEDMLDITEEIVGVIKGKQYVDNFLMENNERIQNVSKLSLMIYENSKKIDAIHQLIDYNKVDLPPLTIFEHFDDRTIELFGSINQFIQTLPLSTMELATLADKWQQIQNDQATPLTTPSQKCRQFFADCLKIIESWKAGDDGQARTASSSSMPKNVFGSSSFAMTDDSNLDDLSGQLMTAKIQNAVQGPKNCIEIGPWSSASNISNWSELSDGRSNVKSIQEPMTLSSYDFDVVDSFTGSFSPSSTKSKSSMMMMKTALSPDQRVVVHSSPRTPNKLDAEPTIDTTTTAASTNQEMPNYSLSSLSFQEIVDETLHTARDSDDAGLVNSNSNAALFEALQMSASKCGHSVSSLLSNPSSSVSESDTQSSYASTKG